MKFQVDLGLHCKTKCFRGIQAF